MAVLAVTGVVVLAAAAVGAMWARSRRDRQRIATLAAEVAELRALAAQNTELEGQLAQALDAMAMGVALVRADGTVVFRNEAAGTWGAGRHERALVEAAVEDVAAAALDGRTAEREVELFGPPAESFLVRAFPLRAERGGVRTTIGAVALVEDTTERTRVDQVRRDFVANISHELRTPIGAMGLLAETICDEPDQATVRRLSRRMVDEAHRASRTIDDLLALARIELDGDIRVEEVGLRRAVDEAVDRLHAAAEQRSIAIEVESVGDPVVRGDHRQLVSAVSNLLDNAVKYSPDGAIVEVEVRATADAAVVSVTDHGIGIPARDLDRVFERFYRVDRARRRGSGGTGLGLAIVRHVAANHGGEATVASKEGEGSTFTLRLPLVPSSSGGPVPILELERHR